jgi:hypothetical protein
MEYDMSTLMERFYGKRVRITETGRRTDPLAVGYCDAVNQKGSGIEIVLNNGGKWELIPEEVTETTIEGAVSASNQFHRKIEIF